MGESGRVVAFDGDPENLERLLINTNRNGFQARIRVVHGVGLVVHCEPVIHCRRGTRTRSQGGVESDGYRPVLVAEIVTVAGHGLESCHAPRLCKVVPEAPELSILCR